MLNLYYNPVQTYQGAGSLLLLPALVQKAAPENSRILLLLCMEDFKHNAVIHKFIVDLGDRVTVECFPYSNPNLEQLYAIYDKTKNLGVGLIIAIGGGSTLDVGKSLCCLYGQEIQSVEQLRVIIAEKRYKTPVCPWIGVPTTAGTGSEVTCWATVWYPQGGVKYSIDTSENYAYAAVADPELLYQMPLGLAVSSALDAAAHAAESYWAKASNTVSRALALSAIRLIMGHMDELLTNPESKAAHDAMSRGSMLAGLAFSNTRTTACHSISYPLTMQYKIPHGVAVSLLLAPVMEFNAAEIPELSSLLEAFRVADITALGKRVQNILAVAGFSSTLRAWGAKEDDLPELVSHSITKGRADNNPVDLTETAVLRMLKGIF